MISKFYDAITALNEAIARLDPIADAELIQKLLTIINDRTLQETK